jgi:Flp pilus assembly protein protease CpaA
MKIVVIPILAWIALVDLRAHRIPNRELLILVIASVATLNFEDYSVRNHLHISIVVISVAIFLSYFCGLGMGDVKLLAVLSLFVLPPYFASYQIFLAVVTLTVLAYSIIISRGDFRKSVQVPLAPAIFLGTLIALNVK